MFEFHKDKKRYFEFQYKTTSEYIIPFLRRHVDLDKQLRVLEIGSAEAGVLKAFTDLGHSCVGIELSESRVEHARRLMEKELKEGRVRFFAKDIHLLDPQMEIGHRFDLILLKDVIEHIHERENFMQKLHGFLEPGGKIFFGFPPWQMPFGGHQQICKSRVGAYLPYYHMLPRSMYRAILQAFGESEATIAGLMEIKESGISIEAFVDLMDRTGYKVVERRLFLTNPIYKYKFGWKVREQGSLIGRIPWFRNFFTSAAYFLVEE